METKVVEWYFIRHGEAAPNENDRARPLTETGKKEVANSVKEHLQTLNLNIVAAFHNGRRRAEETVEIALSLLGSQASPVYRQGFDFEVSDYDQAGSTYPEVLAEVQKQVKAGATETAGLWLSLWKGYKLAVLRGRLEQAICRESELITAESVIPSCSSVVVGSHGCFAELAAVDPKNCGMLTPGGIIKYTVEVSNGVASITSSEILC